METVNRGGLFLPTNYSTRIGGARRSADAINGELIEEFLEWKKSYTKWAFDRYRIWVTRFQEHVSKVPEEMCARDYVGFAESIKEGYAEKSVQFALNIVHNYLRFFAEQGRLGFPMYFVRVPRARAESHYAITGDEFELILDQIAAGSGLIRARDEAMFRLLWDSGMRLGELIGLDVGDLKPDRSAQIPTEKTVTDRHVFWSGETERAIRSYLELRRQGGEEIGRGSPLLRGAKCGGRLTGRAVQRRLKRYCSGAQIEEKICPHSFRHAFIHRMAKKGVPDSVTSVLVGHTSPITVAHYTRLNAFEQRAFYEAESLRAA